MVEEHLYSRLSGFVGLTALVGARIHHGNAPQASATPYVVFGEITAERTSAMGVDTGLAHMRFQFDAWAVSRDSARAVKEQLRLALARYSGTVAGHTIQDIFLVSELSDYEDQTQLHRYSQDFMVHHVE